MIVQQMLMSVQSRRMSVNRYVTTPLVPMYVIVVLDTLLILMEGPVEVSLLLQLM